MAAAWRGVMSDSEPLLKASGEPMADKKGDMLRVGQRVVDDRVQPAGYGAGDMSRQSRRGL